VKDPCIGSCSCLFFVCHSAAQRRNLLLPLPLPSLLPLPLPLPLPFAITVALALAPASEICQGFSLGTPSHHKTGSAPWDESHSRVPHPNGGRIAVRVGYRSRKRTTAFLTPRRHPERSTSHTPPNSTLRTVPPQSLHRTPPHLNPPVIPTEAS
jgi:hypothetical protein